MKKSILFLIVLALISSCSNAPQAAATPEVTVTLPPPPTQTSIPTPTLHPDFLAFQGQIAQSGAYTLNTDGQIEMQTEEGMTMIPDIQIQPDGRMTFTYEGQEFTADPETIKFEGNTFSFKDENGKIWVWDGENLEEAESEGVKQAKADFEKYGYDYTTLKFSENDEGKVVALDPETGEVVYVNGKFDLRFVVKNLKPETLGKTNIEPINGDRKNASREVDRYNAETYNNHNEFL